MLFISGAFDGLPRAPHRVSISQSRCFSFQVRRRLWKVPIRFTSFNLAIEMLFISGLLCWERHRHCHRHRFNLAIEMLFISGRWPLNTMQGRLPGFNLAIEMLFISGEAIRVPLIGIRPVSISQSRGFSFQAPRRAIGKGYLLHRFNLAIEMLFISGRP